MSSHVVKGDDQLRRLGNSIRDARIQQEQVIDELIHSVTLNPHS